MFAISLSPPFSLSPRREKCEECVPCCPQEPWPRLKFWTCFRPCGIDPTKQKAPHCDVVQRKMSRRLDCKEDEASPGPERRKKPLLRLYTCFDNITNIPYFSPKIYR